MLFRGLGPGFDRLRPILRHRTWQGSAPWIQTCNSQVPLGWHDFVREVGSAGAFNGCMSCSGSHCQALRALRKRRFR